MTYPSIIYSGAWNEDITRAQAPAFFGDLGLDQIVTAITAGKQEYDLLPFYYRPLCDIDAVVYRQEVWRDLENGKLSICVQSFAKAMHSVRQHVAQIATLYYERQKQGWFLDEAFLYCEAVTSFVRDLESIEPASRALRAFRAYLADYIKSYSFTALAAETTKLKADLAAIKYTILIFDGGFTVRRYDDESDYSAEVESTFRKFKQGAVRSYSAKFSELSGMNHVEAKILEFVARLFPEIFSALAEYCRRHTGFVDSAIAAFDRDIQFYLSYEEYMAAFKMAGLAFCYPVLSRTKKRECSRMSFDLALATRLIRKKQPIVANDFDLTGRERILVVSGPNQGGKTTFARTFGQLHYLASLGCPVPGTDARLFLFDKVFAHFEREENIQTLRGKLEDELVRLRAIFAEATSDSIIIVNEIFNSTTLHDAIFLGKSVMCRISELDAICVCVTFIDELASLNEKTVSMISAVVPEDPATRTFKIVRRPADGLSYAISIAEKYQLTYERLKERIQP
jgi:DNA mismatch repair protein MutS